MKATSCGIYVRISQDRRGDAAGVQRQEEACRERAAMLGWEVVHVYSDNDLSAYSGSRRPAYTQLLADIESGRIQGLLAWHPDRLHRRPIEHEHFIDLVERKSLKIQTIAAGHYDLSTPSGRMFARSLSAYARMESEHKGQRIAESRKQKAREGKHHGGVRPFGFDKDGVTIREEEAREVAKAADEVIAGVSLRAIVRDLNERGVPTASGRGRWTSTVLRAILISPRAAGMSSWHGEIVGKAVWPALIAEERWRAVVAILTNPTRRTTNLGEP
ncbi:recombinase family protein [Prescottella defluvii]|nr:recombinase family protein [Prescottella defluvii]